MSASFASVGKTIRMSRLFRDDGRAAMVAINHGIAMGPAKGIESMRKIVEVLMPEHPDSFTIHRGFARGTADLFGGRVGLILKTTNATRHFGPQETPVASIQDAVALGADAVSVGLSLCDRNEEGAIAHTARVVSEAEQAGMPTVAHAYPNGSLIDDTARYKVDAVGYAVRVALELGIDIIKTYWTGSAETFAKVVEFGAPSKVVISGGPRCDTLRDCFEMTWQGMQAGAHGITYGRNIWQHDYPQAVMRGLVAITHRRASVDQAMEMASDLAGARLV